MPEENKKASFTFSDKIKSSKESAPKSFANRLSSKIGGDGKPRKTLFERTRRDAPFFIAALVALLLLPFLYKYSGSVGEDKAVMTPGYEGSVFNPDRSGFDFTEGNPDEQISQLTGRDSLDLISGLGGSRTDSDDDYSFSDTQSDSLYGSRSGFEADRSAAQYRRDDMDEEINNTNIYKYRKRAPQQTRAAFRRAATKVGNLRPGGLSGRGGGANIQPWGGSLKAAAQKVRGEKPKNSTKPVSLQPLVAAGKPSRSSFGQGAAAEARRSKDAMSKANPLQALMDAQMRPVTPGKIGGIDGGNYGGPGGGNGNLQRNFNYGGDKPWWWDLMKTRSQMEWERKFNYKWGWIDWATDLLRKFLDPFLSCFFTGTDDWSMGRLFGAREGEGKEKTCCGMNKAKFAGAAPGIAFEKNACKGWVKAHPDVKCESSWDDGSPASSNMSWWQSRRDCWTNGVIGKAGLTEVTDCTDLVHKHYQVTPTGRARKWNTYIYVVARNYLPEASANKMKGERGRDKYRPYLCSDDTFLGIANRHSAGANAIGLPPRPGDGEQYTKANDDRYREEANARMNERRDLTPDVWARDPEALDNACVIYVQKGDTLNWTHFETTMIEVLEQLLSNQGVSKNWEEEARNAFRQLDLMFVESFSAKSKLGGRWLDGLARDQVQLPLPYWQFYDAYVRHKRTATNDKYVKRLADVDRRPYRIEGEEYVMGQRCWFKDQVSIGCYNTDNNQNPMAIVTFKQGFQGLASAEAAANLKNPPVRVTATYKWLNADKDKDVNPKYVEQPMDHPIKPSQFEQLGVSGVAQNEWLYMMEQSAIVRDSREDAEKNPPVGRVVWQLFRNGQLIDTVECGHNLTGDVAKVPVVPEKQCSSAYESEECCKEIMGEDAIWDPNHDPKCYMPEATPPNEDPQSGEKTCLAPMLHWVPSDPASRKPMTDGCKEDLFGASLIAGSGREHCEEQTPLMMDSAAAQAFVKDVVAKYNAQHPELPIVYEGAYPLDGQFVDALKIAQSVGVTTVPAAAVCELGRDFVRISRDKHTGDSIQVTNQIATPYSDANGGKDENMVFHNDLGAFLAYIHGTSILYPQKMYVTNDNCDYRFSVVPEGYPCQQPKAWTNPTPADRRYHHNNYNNVPGVKVYQKYYFQSLNSAQRAFPLAKLVSDRDGLSLQNTVDQCDGTRAGCHKKSQEYVKDISLLLSERNTFTAWQGEACRAFYKNGNGPDIQVEDVLKYVTGACEQGLDSKPSGVPGSSAGAKPRAGVPGADPGAQGTPNQ